MPDNPFQNDPLSRIVMRLLLLLQLGAMVIVLGLSLLDLFFLALAISFLTLLVLIAVLLWLYVRFQKLPIVRQKRDLERLVFKFQKNVQAEADRIQASIQGRDRLNQAEKEEINSALDTLQRNSIENGLESTGPAAPPPGPLDAITQKYQALHDKNNAAERAAFSSQQILEYELMSLKPRLRQLARFTFPRYLSNSLASRGTVAAQIAFVLIVTQVVSSVSATLAFGTSPGRAAAIIASIPTETHTPAATLTPTETSSPTITETPTATAPPSQTFTPTITNRPAPAQTSIPTFLTIP